MSTQMPPEGESGATSGDTAAYRTSEPEGGAQTGEAPKSKASSLFDLRMLIGGLFTLYGVILIIAGFFTTDAELRKADNINMNLWLGLAMLVLGLFFLAWQRLRPLQLGGPSAAEQLEQGAPRPPGGH